MNIKQKIAAATAGGIVVAACVASLTLGVAAPAQAQSTNPPAAATQAPGAQAPRSIGRNQYLADALGITVSQLQTAQTSARNAAIDAALKAGTITQSQADALKSGQGGRGFNLGINVDGQKLLADALNITVDKLQSAEQTAFKAELAQAVTDGRITQQQADLRLAQQALQKYMADKGFAAVVQSAVNDGALTPAQATALLNQAKTSQGGIGYPGLGDLGGPGGPRGFGDFGGHGGKGGPGGLGGLGNPGAQQPNAAPTVQG